MMRLFLVRHGQTIWTSIGRFQGQTDVPLTELGRRQAEALARYFSAKPLHAIYSSDLQRARDTALPIASALTLDLVFDRRLRESSFGEWEGLTHTQMREGWPRQFAAWQADPLNQAPPSGETLAQLTARVATLYGEALARHANENVVFVSHGGTLRALLCHVLELPTQVYWRISLESASVSELRIYDDLRVTINLLNDRHMLDGLPAQEGGH